MHFGKHTLANFIGRYRKQLDPNEIAYLHTTYKGRDWSVLIQGSDTSAAYADAAIQETPISLQKNGLYVRKFRRIQERVAFRNAVAAH